MKQHTLLFLSLLCMMSWGAPEVQAAEEAPQKLAVQEGVPEGFEAFDGPQETVVDLFYGGLKVGSFRSVYTPQSIAFATPDEIVAKIPAIKYEMTKKVQEALTGDLPTRAELVCGHLPEPGCGVLQPEVAAIIFNEGKFRAELFINPAMLAEQDTHTDKILGAAPDVLSSNHAFNAGFSGTESSPDNYSLISNSTIAYGAGRLNVAGLATNQHKAINTISAGIDKWGLESKIGFFESRGMQMLPQASMSGVSVGTSLNTNLILRDAAGSRLTVFLPQRGWVSLIHNGVIHSTDFYEAGNQVLNTDSLPPGAYEITIRIRDASGKETEEKRFFAKNFEIPPEEQGIYYVQAGTIREAVPDEVFPSVGSEFIGALGTVQRLDDNIGLTANMLAIHEEYYNELGMFILFPPDHQLRITGLASSVKDYGVGASYLGYLWDKRIAFALDARAIFAHALSSAEQAKIDVNGVDANDPISEDSKQLGGSVSYQLSERASLSIQGSYGKTPTESEYAYGPTIGYDVWREGDSNLALTLNHTVTNDSTLQSIFLRFSKRLGAWGLNSDASMHSDNPEVGPTTRSKSGSGRVTWNDDKKAGQMTLIGAEVRHDENSDGLNADLDHRSSLGNIKLIGSHTRTDGAKSNFYSGNIGFGIAQSEDDLSLGGNQQQASGVIIKTTGNSEGTLMEVMVDSSKRAVFETGKSVALFLSPYQSYHISIKPAASTAIDYDGAVKKVTLYPGNITTMSWEVNRIFVLLGNVQMPDGTPLEEARLEEARNITITDEMGMFQAEVMKRDHLTFSRAGDEEAEQVAGNVPQTPPLDPKAEKEILAMLPDAQQKQSKPSKMTPVDASRTLLDLYALPAEGVTADAAPEAAVAQPAVVSQQPEKKRRKGLRCRVDLPEVNEMNGVYIYSQPLICHPIPFEPKPIQAAAPTEETKASEETKPAEGVTPTVADPAVTAPQKAEKQDAVGAVGDQKKPASADGVADLDGPRDAVAAPVAAVEISPEPSPETAQETAPKALPETLPEISQMVALPDAEFDAQMRAEEKETMVTVPIPETVALPDLLNSVTRAE